MARLSVAQTFFATVCAGLPLCVLPLPFSFLLLRAVVVSMVTSSCVVLLVDCCC